MGTLIFPYFGHNPHEWYLETELRYRTTKWDILREGFLLTFSFEDDFASTNEALQEIKTIIFRTLQEPLEWVQPDWSIQLRHAMECHNVTVEEDNKDPRNVNIPETEGHHEVKSSQIDNPDITAPLKTSQVNIGTQEEPKFCKYWGLLG